MAKQGGVKKITELVSVQPKFSKVNSVPLKVKRNSDDVDELEKETHDQILVSQTQTQQGNHYRIYVGSMAACEYSKLEHYYAPAIETLFNADENDTIEFLIASEGGYLKVFMMFYNAIMTTEAYTVANIVEEAASAASMLALVCDELVVNELSSMMIHTITSGWYGSLSDEIPQHEHKIKQTRRLFETIYKNFLTVEEIEQVLNKPDKYLNADEIVERWERVKAKRQEEREEIIAEQQEEHLPELIKLVEKYGYIVTKKKGKNEDNL